MIKVTPRARVHQDRAGDPLDGLVNMFDIGIVLAVGFLLAALSSLGLSDAVNENGLTKPTLDSIPLKPGQTLEPVPSEGVKTEGRGTPVGTVYRLADGRLVYVTGDGSTAPVSPDAGSSDPDTAPDQDEQPDDVPDELTPDLQGELPAPDFPTTAP
ncbi:DUF2149 domain-containing protein [Aeromicrobium fastidiosum]|uniref:DUF2149 domain-containing protein n=1 Tax=Aeromicrobium fastidiosum TaxID=52699 RepID=UPI001AE5B230|nr:DUF2149 domain-containing protein [Aeromicrobium fastidiosum]MBP2389133.1 hypothetical protein [Aeromicrobium fastidiosum]